MIIKSLFDKEFIRELRPKMIELSKIHKKTENEILLDENVQNLLINKKLFRIINEILNTNNLLYYSDSSVVNHSNPFKVQTVFITMLEVRIQVFHMKKNTL